MRPALALPPTYGAIGKHQDAYLTPLELRKLIFDNRRFWSFHDTPTTVALSGNRFAKSLSGFTHHTDEPSFRELLREYSDFGVTRPGGYADVFHERFQSPRVCWSVNALLAPCFAGGWQQAISPGAHYEQHYRYDLRSAYLWAASLGMPDTKTLTRSLKPWSDRQHAGVYRVKLLEPCTTAPFPFNQCVECIASNLEIETYGLRIASVVDGVIWKRSLSGDSIVDTVKLVSTWKQAGRAFWGRWGQSAKLTCNANGKQWELPNRALNIPWAHSIVSRVRMRVWEYARRAVHVFVDSLITTERLPTGDNIGDWRLEKIYPNGVIIRGPGQYGSLDCATLERNAGVARHPHRTNAVSVM